MNRNLLNILACPMDKNHPLELFEITEKDNIILEGILFCPKCSRFFPIIEEIPIMLPDELRDKKMELEFLKQNKERIPEKITKKANPWHV